MSTRSFVANVLMTLVAGVALAFVFTSGLFEQSSALRWISYALPVVVTGITLFSIILYVLTRRQKTAEAFYEELLREHRAERYRSKQVSRAEEIVKTKRERFINWPNVSFHYANKDHIRSFYDDYFKEPTIESLVSEIAGEVSGEIKGNIPKVLESRIGGTDLSKWISTIKLPDTSINGMFLRYQRETIARGQVTLGIEEVDVELSELEQFERMITELGEKFGLQIDESLLDQSRRKLKEKAADKTLVKLEQATGWVLVEGRFKIVDIGDFYRCTYLHPVNDYLSGQTQAATISINLRKESLEPHIRGNYLQSVGQVIPLRIYGEVWQPINRQTSVWDLVITPLAVY